MRIRQVPTLVGIWLLIVCEPGDAHPVRPVSASPSSREPLGALSDTVLRIEDFVIAGVHPGMDSASAHRVLGPPDSIEHIREPGGEGVAWHYAGLTLLIHRNGAIGGIDVTRPTFATARGMRV